MGESHLGRVAGAGEHAFAEKGAAEADSIESADQSVLLPAFDRMGLPAQV
jgi:hypothetical protein